MIRVALVAVLVAACGSPLVYGAAIKAANAVVSIQKRVA